MKTSDFYYELPQELIAQDPLDDRSASRLMVLDKTTGEISHHIFKEITDFLRPVDSLFSEMPAMVLDQHWTVRCKNGGEIPAPGRPDGEYRVYGPEGEFLMLGTVRDETLRTVKSFFEVK